MSDQSSGSPGTTSFGAAPSDAGAGGASGAGTSSAGRSGAAAGTGAVLGIGTVAIQNTPAKAIARLTNSQFIHSAAALLGDAAVVGVEALLPEPDIQDGLFRNTGFAQEQLYSVIQGYDAAATAIVANVRDWPAFEKRWGGCTQQACVGTFIQSFVEAAFRRPVTEADVSAFQPILAASTENALSYDDTVQLIVRATLQAPEFLYLFFDPTLTPFQLASRLSYVITDGPPDAALYAAAKNRELSTAAGLNQQIERLLEVGVGSFARAFGFDYLALRKASTRNVNQTDVSSAVDPATIGQFTSSAVETFAALVEKDQPIGSVLTTDSFVVNAPTASWLAGQPSTDTQARPTARYPFLGLLTHPATLIAISNAVFGSTVSRGQFIASQVLCVPPTPPPPPDIQLTDLSALLPANPTARDFGEARMHDMRCAGCHAQFESYSFAMNKWGGDGLYKTDARLVDSGPIKTGLGNIAFDSYRDFMPQLAGSAQFERCMADHVARYGLQHTEYPPELVQTLLDGARGTNSLITFRALLKALVQQPVFATR